MKLPFQLRKRETVEQAEALYLEGQDVAALLRLCEQLDGETWPRIYALSTGFLVQPKRLPPRFFPGAIRLRRLAENLYLPIDADLSPALLNDEAKELTLQRGLIFLPGGRILVFSTGQALTPTAVLTACRVARRSWSSLPERPFRADRIQEILIDQPSSMADQVLDPGCEGIGSEEPGVDQSSGASRMLGGVGQGMIWLGQTLGLKGLSTLGASWIRSAMSLTPKLSEALLMKQETALRNLLREFKEGNVDRALKQALPLSGGSERGAQAHTAAELPLSDLRYSLKDLLGAGGGEARYWVGGFDVQRELAKEYRKAAEEATRRGDYRRAAFIYGRLLQDYALAAGALMQGGLAHDAAILYLEKLNDLIAAARAFETAGEFDQALQLYRRRSEYVQAGDLLSRLGEQEAALQEYLNAAEAFAEAPGGHLRAGELLLKKAFQSDLARRFFQQGWALRPKANAVPCAIELARIDVENGHVNRLFDLLHEAELYFESAGTEREAVLLLQELAILAGQPALSTHRDEIRDRVLMSLTAKLGQQSRSNSLSIETVHQYLGKPWVSNLAFLRDAEFAVKAQVYSTRNAFSGPNSSKTRSKPNRIQIGSGNITAFAFALEAEELYLGFGGGEVFRFQPSTCVVERVAVYPIPVSSLAVDPKARALAVLWAEEKPRRVLAAYERLPDGTFRMTEGRSESGRERPWLSPIHFQIDELIVLEWDGGRFQLLRGPGLLPSVLPPNLDALENLSLLHCIPDFSNSSRSLLLAFSENKIWGIGDLESGLVSIRPLSWLPRLPEGNPLASPPFSCWNSAKNRLEIAGIGLSGTIYRSVFEWCGPVLDLVMTNRSAADEVYLASTLLRPGLVAGVTSQSVHWLRAISNRFSHLSTTEVSIPSAIACAVSRRTGELIVVSQEGWIERVNLPSH